MRTVVTRISGAKGHCVPSALAYVTNKSGKYWVKRIRRVDPKACSSDSYGVYAHNYRQILEQEKYAFTEFPRIVSFFSNYSIDHIFPFLINKKAMITGMIYDGCFSFGHAFAVKNNKIACTIYPTPVSLGRWKQQWKRDKMFGGQLPRILHYVIIEGKKK